MNKLIILPNYINSWAVYCCHSKVGKKMLMMHWFHGWPLASIWLCVCVCVCARAQQDATIKGQDIPPCTAGLCFVLEVGWQEREVVINERTDTLQVKRRRSRYWKSIFSEYYSEPVQYLPLLWSLMVHSIQESDFYLYITQTASPRDKWCSL